MTTAPTRTSPNAAPPGTSTTPPQRRHDPEQRGFASDNYAGVHPELLDAIALANGGHQVSYGEDAYTEPLQEVFGHRLPGLQRDRGECRRAAVDDRALGLGDLRRISAHQRGRVRRTGEGRRT